MATQVTGLGRDGEQSTGIMEGGVVERAKDKGKLSVVLGNALPLVFSTDSGSDGGKKVVQKVAQKSTSKGSRVSIGKLKKKQAVPCVNIGSDFREWFD